MAATSTPSRRSVVRGAAWATPVVAASVATPAFAASPCTTVACPNISFGQVTAAGATDVGAGTAGNGWSASPFPGSWTNRGTNNPVGFRSATNTGGMTTAMGSWFAATAEPTSAGQTITLTQTGQPALAAGCSYTIRFGVVTWNASPVPLRLRALVGTTQVGEYVTGANGATGYADRGFQTFAVPGTASGVVSFQFVFTGGDHGDIKLYQPSVICA